MVLTHGDKEQVGIASERVRRRFETGDFRFGAEGGLWGRGLPGSGAPGIQYIACSRRCSPVLG